MSNLGPHSVRSLPDSFEAPGNSAGQGTPCMAELNGEHRGGSQLWDEIEDTWLESIRIRREREDREAAEKHQASILEERETLTKLFAEREPVIKELARIDGLVKSAQNRITWKENSYRLGQDALREHRQKEDLEAKEFLRTGRSAGQQHQQQRLWPAKNAHPLPSQFGPQRYYHQQSQAHLAQPQAHPPLNHYSQAAPLRHDQRPRSPSTSVDVDGLASQRQVESQGQAEIAIAALQKRHAPGVSEGEVSNGAAAPPARPDVTLAVGTAAPVSAQAAAAGEPAEHLRPVDRASNSAHPGAEANTSTLPLEAGARDVAQDMDMPDVTEKLGVEIYDPEGNFIGEVERIEQRNPWITASLQRPIKRKVEIRAGRKFGPEDLDKIYEPSDSKGTKWLSCMIQATGDVQGRECTTCAKHSGVFSQCVIINGDPHFPRCANCEWARQACTGASLVAQPKSAAGVRPDTREDLLGISQERKSETAAEQLPPRRSLSQRTPSVAEQPQQPGGFTAVNGSATVAKNTPNIHQSVEEEAHENEEMDGQPLPKKERKSLPGARTSHHDAAPRDDSSLKKAKGLRKSLPGRPSQQDGRHNDEAEADEEEDTEEITKALLVFEDDGSVFTEPEIMRGVPLEKITSKHPYWEASWPPLEEFIAPTLEKWQDKYEKALVEAATQSSKYLANRQINRGKAVLKYLREGPIHPLQIISKRFVTRKLFNYDTIHRLVQILDEFQRFNIDCTPAEWVRHRLHQKFLEKGDKFALDEEVDALYHDSKVRFIRKKSGFGNIGRPSGYRMKGEVNSTPKRTQRGTKRKKGSSSTPETSGVQAESGAQVENETHASQTENRAQGPQVYKEPTSRELELQSAPAPTPVLDTASEPSVAPASAPVSELAPAPAPAPTPEPRPTSSRGRRHTRPPTADGPLGSPAPSSTSSRRASKRPKTSHATEPSTTLAIPQPPAAEDLAVDGYTTTDSFSKDPIYRIDWRIYQVKTAKVSSNPRVTQYYHWVDGPDQEASFEHQVLKDVIPSRKQVTWGVFCQPYDFHLRLAELVHVRWARDSLKIVAVTREVEDVEFRGDLIVNFKRERTKRRFLGFLVRKKVPTLRVEGEEIEDAWNKMESHVLSVDDDSE